MPADVAALTIAGRQPLPSPALPTALVACAATTVSVVMPRAWAGKVPKPADYDSGTSVRFANGGYQVSYDREPKLLAAKPHDPVMMCLVSIPHHCPKDDDRGRFYMVTDTRTGGAWTLPDAEHLCGVA